MRLPPPPLLSGKDWALFLDIDGTLLPVPDSPSGLVRDEGFVPLLRNLQGASDGALALVSGRPRENIDRLVAPLYLPLAGQHGLERRDAAGRLHRHDGDNPVLAPVRDAARALIDQWPALELEDKGLSLALHFRRAPELGALVRTTLGHVLAGHGDRLVLQAGKDVFEVKPRGQDKGRAIRQFMAEEPFAGRLPVFLGDDSSDEHGFRVVNEMEGLSIKVGEGDTSARFRLADSAAVRRWLPHLLPPRH